jgi:hypothetical protein
MNSGEGQKKEVYSVAQAHHGRVEASTSAHLLATHMSFRFK